MQVAAIVQARMSSQRLAGKVLKQAMGKPMLQYLHERMVHCRSLAAIIVSTSTDASDDPIAQFCQAHRIAFFRGPLLDVAGRFKLTLEHLACDAFVRVNADSPLLDQHLIDRAVQLFHTTPCDLVTNVFPPSFPAGQSVEVLRSETFCQAYGHMQDARDREHVTRFFYRHQEKFKIVNFMAPDNLRRLHLAVDTQSDFDQFCTIVRHMKSPPWTYALAQLVEIADMLRLSAAGAAA